MVCLQSNSKEENEIRLETQNCLPIPNVKILLNVQGDVARGLSLC